MEKILKEKNLEASIFQVEKGKKNGFKAFLNINGLPHLFTCIKSELSPLENSCLNEYELQNHIIELCFLPNKFTKLHNIIEFILQEIRNNIKFWILNSDIYSQIADNTKLLQDIQEVSIEKTEKTNKNDTNFEGIDNYLKYISQVTTLKRKYKFIQEYENIKEPEIIKPKIQENIPLIESNEKIIGDLLEEKNIQNIQTTQNNQELFEKFLLMNDTQRMTRHQKKRLCDDSNLISQDLSKYITQKSIVMRKKREAEILISIFMPNRFLKYPKIEFQVFPYIFKFLIKDLKTILDKKQEFHLQNFLFYMLLQEKQTKKKFRMNQNLFSDGQKDLEEEIPKANEEILSDEDKSLLDFYLFCHNDVVFNNFFLFVIIFYFLGFFD